MSEDVGRSKALEICQCQINFDKTRMLAREPIFKKRLIKESVEIHSCGNKMNGDKGYQLPNEWKTVIEDVTARATNRNGRSTNGRQGKMRLVEAAEAPIYKRGPGRPQGDLFSDTTLINDSTLEEGGRRTPEISRRSQISIAAAGADNQN